MLNDREFAELLEDIQSEDVSLRVETLKDLSVEPTADARVLNILKVLINDTTPCILRRPYQFGELRYLAARSLASEYAAQNIKDSIVIKGVVTPLSTDELISIAEKAGIKKTGGLEGMLDLFEVLREKQKLPLTDIEV